MLNINKIQIQQIKFSFESLTDKENLKDNIINCLKDIESFLLNEKSFSFKNEHFNNEWYFGMKELFDNQKVIKVLFLNKYYSLGIPKRRNIPRCLNNNVEGCILHQKKV